MNWNVLWTALGETLYMAIPSTLIAYLIGLPLGVLLVITRKGGVKPLPTLNAVVGALVNFLRSIPFLILLAMLFPVTRAVMGKAVGTKAIIFPLTVSAFPYVARMVEGSLNELDQGVIESAKAMGATNLQIVTRVILPETLPSLLRGMAVASITIVGYTAMAGAVGGGGLGDVAIRYGYYRRENAVLFTTLVILIVLVQLIQWGFQKLVDHIDKSK